MRSVNVWLQDLKKITIPIGFEGENLYTTVNINCKEIFDENDSFVPTLVITSPSGEMYPGIVTRNGDVVTWQVTASDLVKRGIGELQLAFTHDEVIGKTYVAKTRIERSLVPDEEVPTEIENFIIEAGTIVNGIPQAIQDALTEAKESGEFDGAPGEDGYTPVKGVDYFDGEPGTDGFSPTATVSKSGKTTTITITDKNGTTSAEVLDGEDGSGGDIIDDTAGDGDTDKTWSADKLNDLKSTVDAKTEVFLVTLTTEVNPQTGSLAVLSDKTVAEILEAEDNGSIIHAVMDLMSEESMMTEYTSSKLSQSEGSVTFTVRMDNQAVSVLGLASPNADDTWTIRMTSYMVANYNNPLITPSFSAGSMQIKSLATPTANTDAATKAYVDTAVSGKQNAPSSAGTAGQVLSLDNNLSPVWSTPSSGGGDVTDVQVNGASVVSNGIADVPVATLNGDYGVVKFGSNSLGLETDTNGRLRILEANDTLIKSGGTSDNKRVINPYVQHKSVFYGLAKAAGDTTQASSSNAVGTYTNDAKTAIKTMLGVTDPAVSDVQINGTSVITNGVANIPHASSSVFGLVRPQSQFGTEIRSTNNGEFLSLYFARSSEIKNPDGNNIHPLTPYFQHESVFYGLAKAAGDTTQAASSNAVGTYTDGAKTAIKTMLGVQEGLEVVRLI